MNSQLNVVPTDADIRAHAAQPCSAQSNTGYGSDRQWLASINIELAAKGDKTHIRHLKHQGPLRVQRPFHPEPKDLPGSDCCHVYLLHPPGGLVSGDHIRMAVDVGPGAHGLVTTPSAGKLYRGDSCGVPQRQDVVLKVRGDALLEWLPQETILFDGALGETRLQLELDAESRFIGWEIFCLGRPVGDLPFNTGWFRQQLQIHREGLPLLLEKQHLVAGSEIAKARWGFNGQPVSGTLMAVGFAERPDALIREIRAQLQAVAGDEFAVTWRLGVLVGRYLGGSTERARACFTRLWQLTRPALLNKEAVIPRIWNT